MRDIIHVGIIGVGRIGRLHAENVALMPGVKIVSIADILMNDEIKKWAHGIGVDNIYTDADKVIHDESIDAVLICSSTSTHADYIIRCAKAGKHIFCEKPIDFNLDKIYTALREVEKAGVKLQVGFVRRFDHNHKKVRDVVASGRLGRPHIVKVTSRDPAPQAAEYVKVSGGIFMDMTIHDFDMARYLSGSEVTEVAAYGNVLIDENLNNYDDVDTAIVMLKFENGSIGVIDNSRRAGYGYDQRTEVHCDKGCVQVFNDVADSAMISTAEGVQIEKPLWFFIERYNNAFISEIRAFIDAIKNNKDTLVNGIDGLMPVKIAIAAKKSLKERRSVNLSEI